jgi:ferredoxin-like protein FixX
LPLNEKWSEKHLCNAMLQLEASLDREALVWQSTKDRQDWLGRLRKYVNECPNETNPKDDQKVRCQLAACLFVGIDKFCSTASVKDTWVLRLSALPCYAVQVSAICGD